MDKKQLHNRWIADVRLNQIGSSNYENNSGEPLGVIKLYPYAKQKIEVTPFEPQFSLLVSDEHGRYRGEYDPVTQQMTYTIKK